MVEKKDKKKTSTTSKVEKKTPVSSYGSMVFGVGLLISIVASFLTLQETSKTIVAATLLILGLVVGIINISNKEVIPFLLAVIVFASLIQPFMMAVVQTFQIINPFVLQTLGNLFANLMLFIVPAAIVVSLKVLFIVAKDE